MQNVLITGGAGYVGHLLTPRLLSEGYHVTVYDQLYFGCRLPNSPDLKVIQGDIRDTPKLAEALVGQDAVLHLACISNDASFELDEKLSESINYDCFEPLVVAAKQAGVKRFVYCSSSSVYGVSDSPDVTEDHPLVPLTLYNKFKGMCEPILWKHRRTISPASSSARPPSADTPPAPASISRSTSSPTTRSTKARSRCSAATRCGRTCMSTTWSMPTW